MAGVENSAKRLRYILKRVAKEYKIPVPKLVFIDDKDSDFAGQAVHLRRQNAAGTVLENKTVIYLNRPYGGRNTRSLLHELAHAIIWIKKGPEAEPHGRDFMGVYLFLCEWFLIEPISASVRCARAYGVKVRNPYNFHPKRF